MCERLKTVLTDASIRLGGPASYGSYAVAKRIGKIDKTLDLRGLRVLDLGCGNGCYTEELARRAEFVCGIDLHMPHLQAFQEAIPRVQGRGEQLPVASDSCDAVTMIEVLEHTESDAKVLTECFRVLKPGGLLVLFVPNKLYPLESHPCHVGGLGIGPNIPLVSWLPEFLHRRLCHARIYTRRKLLSLSCTGESRESLKIRPWPASASPFTRCCKNQPSLRPRRRARQLAWCPIALVLNCLECRSTPYRQETLWREWRNGFATAAAAIPSPRPACTELLRLNIILRSRQS